MESRWYTYAFGFVTPAIAGVLPITLTFPDKPPPPVINISPATSELLASPVQSFSWQTDSSEIAEWWLYAGTTPGARDISDSGNLKTTTSFNVEGIPSDAENLFIRLWYLDPLEQIWKRVDYAYKTIAP